MYTSIVFAAVTGFVMAPAPSEPATWQRDYAQARTIGKQQQKPLAVVIGTGNDGFQKLTGNGKLPPAVQQLVSEKYIPVYLDVNSPAGKRLADFFKITQGAGIVLSDRTGDFQAFHHNGTIGEDILLPYLQRFAQSGVAVTETVTVNTQRVSYYQNPANPGTTVAQPGTAPAYQPYTPIYQPSYFTPSFGGGGCSS
jgi:hypothetical protein